MEAFQVTSKCGRRLIEYVIRQRRPSGFVVWRWHVFVGVPDSYQLLSIISVFNSLVPTASAAVRNFGLYISDTAVSLFDARLGFCRYRSLVSIKRTVFAVTELHRFPKNSLHISSYLASGLHVQGETKLYWRQRSLSPILMTFCANCVSSIFNHHSAVRYCRKMRVLYVFCLWKYAYIIREK